MRAALRTSSRTSWPASTSAFTVCAPTKPVPPVTRTRIAVCLPRNEPQLRGDGVDADHAAVGDRAVGPTQQPRHHLADDLRRLPTARDPRQPRLGHDPFRGGEPGLDVEAPDATVAELHGDHTGHPMETTLGRPVAQGPSARLAGGPAGAPQPA